MSTDHDARVVTIWAAVDAYQARCRRCRYAGTHRGTRDAAEFDCANHENAAREVTAALPEPALF